MISKAASTISAWLLSSGAISEKDRSLYEYAAYSFIFSLAPLVIVAIIGSIIGMLAEGIILILPFMFIRKFSGGYHLKSSRICFVTSTLVIILFLLLVEYIISENLINYFAPFVIACTIQIYIISPIGSDARQLSLQELLVFRKIARIIVIAIACIFLLAYVLSLNTFAICIGGGIALTAVLQWPCMVKNVANIYSVSYITAD